MEAKRGCKELEVRTMPLQMEETTEGRWMINYIWMNYNNTSTRSFRQPKLALRKTNCRSFPMRSWTQTRSLGHRMKKRAMDKLFKIMKWKPTVRFREWKIIKEKKAKIKIIIIRLMAIPQIERHKYIIIY